MSERICDHGECCRYYICAHPMCCGYDGKPRVPGEET